MPLIFSDLLYSCFGRWGVLGCSGSFLHTVPLRKCFFFYDYRLSFPYTIIAYFLVFISLVSQRLILTDRGQPECVSTKESSRKIIPALRRGGEVLGYIHFLYQPKTCLDLGL